MALIKFMGMSINFIIVPFALQFYLFKCLSLFILALDVLGVKTIFPSF